MWIGSAIDSFEDAFQEVGAGLRRLFLAAWLIIGVILGVWGGYKTFVAHQNYVWLLVIGGALTLSCLANLALDRFFPEREF